MTAKAIKNHPARETLCINYLVDEQSRITSELHKMQSTSGIDMCATSSNSLESDNPSLRLKTQRDST